MKRNGKHPFDAVAAALALSMTIIVVLVVLAIGSLFLTGCTTTKYVPMEVVRTEYKDNVREIRTTDSVIDTRFVYIKGDTVIDYRDRVKWRDRYIHDTLSVDRHDSIPVPYPVEKPLTKWEETEMCIGGITIFVLLTGVICLLLMSLCDGFLPWLIKRFKR